MNNALDFSLGFTLFRQVLQVAAGIAVGKGLVDEATATVLIGGLISIGTGVWAIVVKRRTNAVAAVVTPTA
jgi:hydrogenase/urease accessory protein HupE